VQQLDAALPGCLVHDTAYQVKEAFWRSTDEIEIGIIAAREDVGSRMRKFINEPIKGTSGVINHNAQSP
jgi:hypothetical protein